LSEAPSLLVIRRDNIGDLACTTPLIEALRRRFPAAWIAALVNSYNAEVLARNPALDAVYAYEKLKHRRGSLAANLWQRVKLLAELRGRRIDCVLAPSATPQAGRMARFLRPGRLVVETPQAGHEVERSFALGAALGISGAPGPMRVYPDAAKAQALRKRFAAAGRIVAVHISARRPAQRWPPERYAGLIAALRRHAQVMLLWAPGARDDPRHPGDDEPAREIAASAAPVAMPTPDLATLVAALSLADMVVCPDGGAMHLAAALGKPLVALFGDSSLERWRPWGVPHRVVQPASRHLRDLSVEEVLAACRELARVSQPA
jgi:heptosyltransferase III